MNTDTPFKSLLIPRDTPAEAHQEQDEKTSADELQASTNTQ